MPLNVSRGGLLLQYLALCRLGVPEIHHLVQQLVYDDEVVSYTLFLELFEVFCKDFDDLVEEEKDLGSVCVALCEGK